MTLLEIYVGFDQVVFSTSREAFTAALGVPVAREWFDHLEQLFPDRMRNEAADDSDHKCGTG